MAACRACACVSVPGYDVNEVGADVRDVGDVGDVVSRRERELYGIIVKGTERTYVRTYAGTYAPTDPATDNCNI